MAKRMMHVLRVRRMLIQKEQTVGLKWYGHVKRTP